jgi:hypothetical protein
VAPRTLAALALLCCLPAAAQEAAPPPAWPWTFPIWGRQAAEQGADLPLPMGISLLGSWQRDDILISDVRLGLGTRRLVPADFLELGLLRNHAYLVAARVDLWVLPLLDVYVLGGPIWTRTEVNIRQPFDIRIRSSARGFNGGVGGTAALANAWGFVSVDTNVTFTKLDILSRPQMAFMLDPRVGHRFDPIRGQILSLWVGGTYQTLVNRSIGSVPLSSTVDITTRPIDPRYLAGLSQAQRDHLNQIIADAALAQAEPGARLYYDLQVKPVEAWSMNAGAQVEIGKHWQAMVEGNFLGSRRGMLLYAGRRFGI